MSPRPAAWLWPLLVVPGAAAAHSPIAGIGNFYNGILHPFVVPAHVLLLAAAGLLFGQQGPKQYQSVMLVFPVAVMAGLAGAWWGVAGGLELAILATAAIMGLLIAASPRLGLYGCATFVALSGFIVALDSTQETLAGRDKVMALAGSGLGMCALFLYPMAFADSFKRRVWQQIGTRVLGSWVAASALLVLSLSFAARA